MARKNKNGFEKEGYAKKPGLFSRIFGPIKLLLNLHMKMAAQEIKKDLKRLAVGIISFILFLFFGFIFYIFLNVLAVFFFIDIIHLKAFYAVMIITGFNLLLMLVFLSTAKAKMKKPLFSETKKSFKDTLNELK